MIRVNTEAALALAQAFPTARFEVKTKAPLCSFHP